MQRLGGSGIRHDATVYGPSCGSGSLPIKVADEVDTGPVGDDARTVPCRPGPCSRQPRCGISGKTPHRSGCGRQAPDSRLDARRLSRRAVDDPARVPRRTFSVPYPGNHLRATQRDWSRSGGWWRRSPGQASWCSIRSVVRAQPGDGRQPWPAAVRNCVRSRASAVRRSGILDEKRSSVPSPLAADGEGGGAWVLWRSPRDGATAACESGANYFRIYPHGRCARGADRLRSSRTKAEPRP